MATFISAMRNGAKLLERRDDDGFDRLSNRYTVGILGMCVTFLAVKNYVGEPIACMGPIELSIAQRKYIDGTCWSSGTYYVPPNKPLLPTIPPQGLTRGQKVPYENEIGYYQFVPLCLTFMALTFFAPAQIWSWASNSAGYDVEAMVKATKGTSNINPEVRDKTVRYLVSQMDRLLGYRRPVTTKGMQKSSKGTTRLSIGKRNGSYLFYMYLFHKILYIGNAIGLLYGLDLFLGDGYHYYGMEMIRRANDPTFMGSERFPYGVLCDYWLRKLGQNSHKYTVHCVLSANLFNDKIFGMLWFWLVFIAAASSLGFLLWAVTGFMSLNRKFVIKYLRIMGRLQKSESWELVDPFVRDYLRLDGCFCLRLILKNTNDAIGGEILAACWDHYLQNKNPALIATTGDDSLDGLLRRADDEASV